MRIYKHNSLSFFFCHTYTHFETYLLVYKEATEWEFVDIDDHREITAENDDSFIYFSV